jgi:hypothetical protein
MLQQEKERRSDLELDNVKLQTGFEAEKKKTASLREPERAVGCTLRTAKDVAAYYNNNKRVGECKVDAFKAVRGQDAIGCRICSRKATY